MVVNVQRGIISRVSVGRRSCRHGMVRLVVGGVVGANKLVRVELSSS